jgi:hypothetical protein
MKYESQIRKLEARVHKFVNQRAMKSKTIENNFSYHAPKEGQTGKHEELCKKAKELAYSVDVLCPDSREKTLAMANLERAVMWANASIARN